MNDDEPRIPLKGLSKVSVLLTLYPLSQIRSYELISEWLPVAFSRPPG